MPLRPASSEGRLRLIFSSPIILRIFFAFPRLTTQLFAEIECWNHAAASLSTLSAIYSGSPTIDTIGRVNRLISAWPADDTLPAEGLDSVKSIYKKLVSGLEEIRLTSEKEIKSVWITMVIYFLELNLFFPFLRIIGQ